MKEAYRELCRVELSIPLFCRAWWLDATCGENGWDAVCVEEKGRIVAAMPFKVSRRYGKTILSQPPLTQHLGPWLKPSSAKYVKRLSKEKALLTALVNEMPSFGRYAQNWSFVHSNWLPFYWQGYQQTTGYTYRLNDLTDMDAVRSGMRENIRTEINKATNRFALKVAMDASIEEFLALNKQVFERQGKRLPYSEEYVLRLDNAVQTHGARQIISVHDDDGTVHAAAYITWDETSAYYLMGGSRPDLRHSGAVSLCLWEAIKFSATVTKSFDFEGSMLEPVERYFRAFGGTQMPYFKVSKDQSRLIRLLNIVRMVLGHS